MRFLLLPALWAAGSSLMMLQFQEEPEAQCFTCTLGAVSVPARIAWLAKKDPGFYRESRPLGKYWERLANATPAGLGLHEQCGITGNVSSRLYAAWAAKKGRGSTAGEKWQHPGLLLLFRGGKTLGTAMVAMAKSMTHDQVVISRGKGGKKGRKPKGARHHLFCCQGLTPDLRNTTCEFRTFRLRMLQTKRVVRQNLDKGRICLLHTPRHKFSRDQKFLGDLVAGRNGVVPDVIVASGGNFDRSVKKFDRQFQKAMGGYRSFLNGTKGGGVKLILVSNMPNGKRDWQVQRGIYETMRKGAMNASQASLDVSYIDLHTLAGVDGCGAAQNFPSRSYWNFSRACGNSSFSAASYMAYGGLYLHLSELLTHTVAQPVPRCDPGAFVPWDKPGEAPEDQQFKERFKARSLARRSWDPKDTVSPAALWLEEPSW